MAVAVLCWTTTTSPSSPPLLAFRRETVRQKTRFQQGFTCAYTYQTRIYSSLCAYTHNRAMQRRIPIPSLPLKYRRKSQSLSDYDDDEEYRSQPQLHFENSCSQPPNDAVVLDYSSASSSPIATSAALGSSPNSPTDYSQVRYQSSPPTQGYYYAYNNSSSNDPRASPSFDHSLSSACSSSKYSHTWTRDLSPVLLTAPPVQHRYSAPYRRPRNPRSLYPPQDDLDLSGYSEDMDVDNG